jgi:hypothetical protein
VTWWDQPATRCRGRVGMKGVCKRVVEGGLASAKQVLLLLLQLC